MTDQPLGEECDLDALIEWRYSGYRQRIILGAEQAYESIFNSGGQTKQFGPIPHISTRR